MVRPNEIKESSSSSAGMHFITSSNIGKVDPATRKLIRSHVMRGKKQKKSRLDKNQRATGWGTVAGRGQASRVKLEELVKLYTPPAPLRVGSDLSFLENASEVDPLILISTTKISSDAMRVIFPLMMAIGFEADNREWPNILGQDVAALHISVFAIESFIDKILRHKDCGTNPTAMLHLQKGLNLLQDRLVGEDDELKISDSTMGAVLKLAGASHFIGDYNAAKLHLKGLRRMVDLRGGLNVFKGKHLLIEMLRCDLGVALLNGSPHVFFCDASEPTIEYPVEVLPASGDKMCSQDNTELVRNMDKKLTTAWLVMKRFCYLVNLSTQTARFIRLEVIHETMIAVFYRLLDLKFARGSMDELVRHGLLCFCYHVFLQWQDIKLPYHHFTNAYRGCILELKHLGGVPYQYILWMLMIGATSILDVSADAAWLREDLREYAARCGVKTWKEAQEILKSFMWISLLDDQPGKHVFDLLDLEVKKP